MRTSLNKIKEIENHLSGYSSGEEAILFEAKMIIDSSIKEQVLWQKKTYHYIHLYGRSQLKEEMEAVYRKLVSEPEYKSFRQKIASIFSKH